MAWKTCMRSFCKSWTLWFSILIPLAFLPLPLIHQNSVARCGYCVILMAVFWISEIIPLAVTSLFPVFLFPLFGILKTKEVCAVYIQNTLMLFLASLIIAVAVEKWNLHKRIALRTLTLVGPAPHWLLLGVMLPTWFLSMWMSNTASTAMMMPIVSAILAQIESCTVGTDTEGNDAEMIERLEKPKAPSKDDDVEMMEMNNTHASSSSLNYNEKRRQFEKTAKTFSLATAYSANIGGMATLTGTPTNIFFKGFADDLFARKGGTNPINFANWLAVGVPMSIIIFLFVWGWLLLYSRGIRCLMCWRKDRTSYERVRQMLQKEYASLGPMSFAEIMVSVSFAAIALLWVTRNPGFIPGWGSFFLKGYVGDSCPAVLIAVLLFILPAYPMPWMGCGGKGPQKTDDSKWKYVPILDWEIVNRRLAWGVLLLMGGGFALALGCEKSGLSAWVSDHMEVMSELPPWTIALLLTIVVAMATEVTSNSATVSLFAPIVGEFALRLGINPLYFMLPISVACSLAFLLPVATPPNAIVFAAGYLKVKDMVMAGILINIVSVLTVTFGLNTWITALYDLSHMPEGFNKTITTPISQPYT